MPRSHPILRAVLLLAAGVLAALASQVCLTPARSAPPARAASNPSTAPAAATTRATPEAPYPPPQLAKAAEAAAARMLAHLDDSFHAVVQPPFVVIGNLPAARVRRMADHSVVRPANAMWRGYFQQKPTHVITVLLFRDGETYRHWAKKLFRDTRVPHFGYYKPSLRTMVMNIGTGTGTLVHELTHALIAYDYPSVPTWFNEGLASLHEQCYVQRDTIVGDVNWRLPSLQEAIRDGRLRPLRELVTRDDFYGRLRGLNYAQARYFVMYMQKRGLLKRFYRDLRRDLRRHLGVKGDVKVIEEVFGAPIDRVESDYLKWAMTLRWPKR